MKGHRKDSDIDFEGLQSVSSEDESEKSDNEVEEASEEDDAKENWTSELSSFNLRAFSGQPGLLVQFRDDAKSDDFFTEVFGETTLDRIVVETNRYARQSLENKPRRLAQWKDITKAELKAYFGICVLRINKLPKIADYWSSEEQLQN